MNDSLPLYEILSRKITKVLSFLIINIPSTVLLKFEELENKKSLIVKTKTR